MPKIELNFTVEKGLRALAAFTAHNLSPLRDSKTGEPYTELQLLKRGLITLVAREVHAYERGQAMISAHAAMDEAENSVTEDPDIAN